MSQPQLRRGRSLGCRKCRSTRLLRVHNANGPVIEPGMKFNSWTVLSFAERRNEDYWHCRCDCGTLLSLRRSQLLTGRSQGCAHCRWKRIPFEHLVTVPLTINKDIAVVWLTHGLFSLIDTTDWADVSIYTWSTKIDKRNPKSLYAVNHDGGFMHRFLMKPTADQEVDHIHGNTLDNRRSQLRLCNHGQNSRNRKTNSNAKSSKFKGVCWHKNHNCWVAQIGFNGTLHRLGNFRDEVEAAKAYDAKAREYFGAFAKTNFPDPSATVQ